MPPEQEQTLASRLRAWAGMQTPSESAASGSKAGAYAAVATRFSEGGCEAISNKADQQRLADFANESSAVKVKVPGAGQLNTAVQTCKGPTA